MRMEMTLFLRSTLCGGSKHVRSFPLFLPALLSLQGRPWPALCQAVSRWQRPIAGSVTDIMTGAGERLFLNLRCNLEREYARKAQGSW